MTRLVRAEFLKLRTTQVWFWLLVGTIGISALLIVAQIAPSGGVRHASEVPEMITSASTAYIVVFVLGVLGVTTEFRYQTITPTILQTPSRWSIVTAKMITYAILGAVYALVALAAQLAVAVPWLSSKNVTVDFGNSHVQQAMLAVFGTVALFGIVGLGVGALVKNQIVAVVVGIIFLAILENLLLLIPVVRYAWLYTPAGASQSILHVSGTSTRIEGSLHLLPVGAGVLVLLLWAFVPAIIGASFTMNRDIT